VYQQQQLGKLCSELNALFAGAVLQAVSPSTNKLALLLKVMMTMNMKM